jgi:hypothetical protein
MTELALLESALSVFFPNPRKTDDICLRPSTSGNNAATNNVPHSQMIAMMSQAA